jgi:hypothetical protein
VTLNGKRVITRSIYQRDRQVVFVDEYGSYACEEVGQEGVYTWVGSGNALTLTLNMNFPPAFAGNRIVYAAARSNGDALNSGWQAVGTRTMQ